MVEERSRHVGSQESHGFDEQAAPVELVGPDGRSVDVLTVPLDDLELVPFPHAPHAPGRLAG